MYLLFVLSDVRPNRSTVNGDKPKSHTVVLTSTGDGNFLSNRFVNIWNALPSHIVQCPSVAMVEKNTYRIKMNV